VKFAQLWPCKNNTVPIDDQITRPLRHFETLRILSRRYTSSESHYSVDPDSFFAGCLVGAGRVALARSAAFLRCK
jgi:hypothetical protein